MLSARKWVPVTLAVLMGVMITAYPALAKNGHGLVNSFGGTATTVKDAEPLSEPTGIAWSQKTGEIYVIDSGHDRIERFSATGAYEGRFGGFSSPVAIAVDNDPGSLSFGDIYVSDPGHDLVDKFEPEPSGEVKLIDQLQGPKGGVFEEPKGVAVDPSGNLWVDDRFSVDEFNDVMPSNDSVEQYVLEELPRGTGIAVDAKDDVYFISSFATNATKFTPGIEGYEFFAGIFGCKCGTGIAIDPATNNVYVDQGKSVQEYPPFGEPFETAVGSAFGSEDLGGSSGIAVSANGVVYITSVTANDVEAYEEGSEPEPPTTETVVAEGLSATLEGKLAGGESAYHFEYNTNGVCTGGTKTPVVAATGTETVSGEITGLTARTQYTFCLVADGTYGHPAGAPVSFETKASAPTVGNANSTVKKVAAMLGASVNPEREPSTCVFQYGKSETYEHEASCEQGALGEGVTGVPVSVKIAGLEPATTYDYRVLASNSTGDRAGVNETFTTEVITPSEVETAPAADVTSTSAKFGGQINPQGGATYYVEYGSPECSLNGKPNYAWWLCASKTAEAGPLSGNTLQQVTPIQVAGLTPGATYKYWIVATNKNGTERGEEMTFTTPTLPASPAPVGSVTAPIIAPLVVLPAVVPALKVTITGATVKGETLVLGVRTTVAGAVTITGPGLSKTTKTLAAGTHQVTILLKNRNKQSKHKKITVQVTLKAAGKNATAVRAVKL